VNVDCDALYLKKLATSDPEVEHVIIRDNAGFASLRSPLRGSLRRAVSLRSAHLRDGDTRLPSRARIVPLPPYRPELNPCEQAWDVSKDEISNHCHNSIDKLREALLPSLKRFWEDAQSVLRLVGRPWLRDQANVSSAPPRSSHSTLDHETAATTAPHRAVWSKTNPAANCCGPLPTQEASVSVTAANSKTGGFMSVSFRSPSSLLRRGGFPRLHSPSFRWSVAVWIQSLRNVFGWLSGRVVWLRIERAMCPEARW
jgi:transposase